MRFQWLLSYLRMRGYSCTIVAVIAYSGEVIRIAPLDYYGLLGTFLIVQSFNYDGDIFVVYLAQTTFLYDQPPGRQRMLTKKG